MKGKQIGKILVDIGMTIVLLLLMAYELIGQAVHEWLGVGIFVLAVAHHVLNGRWSRSLLKGRYTALRVWQTALAGLVLLSMLGSMVSGVILSRQVFAFLPISGGLCQEPPYDFRLLGLRADVPSPGVPLEHDDGDGQEDDEGAFPGAQMGFAGSGPADGGIWGICLFQTAGGGLPADDEPFRVF